MCKYVNPQFRLVLVVCAIKNYTKKSLLKQLILNLLCLHNKLKLFTFETITDDTKKILTKEAKLMKHQETIDYHLKITWQNIANKYNQLAGEFGITQSIGYLLINIDDVNGTTVSEVAALLGLKSTSLSRMLNNLEQDGLIYRESHLTDKRSVKLYLTDLGKEKRHLARVVVRKFNDHLDAHLSETERAQLIEKLMLINELTTNYKP